MAEMRIIAAGLLHAAPHVAVWLSGGIVGMWLWGNLPGVMLLPAAVLLLMAGHVVLRA